MSLDGAAPIARPDEAPGLGIIRRVCAAPSTTRN